MLLALAPSTTAAPPSSVDQRLLDAAASVFGCLTAALLRRQLARGRRGVERPFDQILQQQIQLARETGPSSR